MSDNNRAWILQVDLENVEDSRQLEHLVPLVENVLKILILFFDPENAVALSHSNYPNNNSPLKHSPIFVRVPLASLCSVIHNTNYVHNPHNI